MNKSFFCLLFLSAFSLGGCGGGGGGSDGGGQNSLTSTPPANSAPDAKLVSSVSSGISPLEVEFDASGSADSDGSIESYSWDFGDGNTASGPSVTHTFDAGTIDDKTFTVTLTVIDDDGAQSSTTTSITAQKNSEPKAEFSYSQPDASSRLVQFDGSASSDEETEELSFRWSFGDGSTSDRMQPEHEYTENGKYFVQLLVDDLAGRSATVEKLVTVTNGRFRVSGHIDLAANTVVDSDSNNRASRYVANNNLDEPQKLPLPAEVIGFATFPGTGGGEFGDDRFANAPDEFDVFLADLTAGQRIRLHIADWESGANDLDLYLLDDGGNLRAFAAGMEEYEELNVPASGTYYVVIQAWWGRSGYHLSLPDSAAALVSAVKSPVTNQTEFVVGEVLGKSKSEFATGVTNSLRAAAAISVNARADRALRIRASDEALAAVSKRSRSRTKGMAARLADGIGAVISPGQRARLKTITALKRFRHSGQFEYVELNRLRKPFATDDPLFGELWHYQQVGIPQSWPRATGAGRIVAVIDTGIVPAHEDLAGQLVPGYDFISDPAIALDGDGIDADPADPGDDPFGSRDSWHGSHVAGTIAAAANNSVGIAGAAYGAKIMPLRVIGYGGGTEYDISQAIYYAAGLENDSGTLPDRRADVINLSLGGLGHSQVGQDAITAARGAGSIVVAAAGNDSSDADLYSPAGLDGVVTVAAVGRNGAPAPYTNRGSSVEVTAPGGNQYGLYVDSGVLSTVGVETGEGVIGSGYAAYQGTSMAAPHVSAIIAMMKEVATSMTPAQFDQLLAEFAVTGGSGSRDAEFGYGLINAARAIDAAAGLAGEEPIERLYFEYGNQLNLWRATSGEIVLSATAVDLSVTGWETSVSWLTATYVETDVNGIGRYRIAVDGADLDPGSHLGQLTFLASNGTEVELYVSFTQTGAEHSQGAYGGAVYVLLLDYATSEVVNVVEAVYDDERGGYLYQSGELATGQGYWLLAGSDPDNDYTLCEVDELCAFHNSSETQGAPLEIAPGDYGGDVDGIDLVLDVERPQSAGAMLLQPGQDLLSRAAESITPPIRRP